MDALERKWDGMGCGNRKGRSRIFVQAVWMLVSPALLPHASGFSVLYLLIYAYDIPHTTYNQTKTHISTHAVIMARRSLSDISYLNDKLSLIVRMYIYCLNHSLFFLPFSPAKI